MPAATPKLIIALLCKREILLSCSRGLILLLFWDWLLCVSFGIGADYAITDGASVGIEWARLFNVNGSKFEGLSVGASFKF